MLVGSGNSGQFAALTARQDEVTPRAGPLRAITVWPQVGLPASRALVASASMKTPHLTHGNPPSVVPAGTRLLAAGADSPTRAEVPGLGGSGFIPSLGAACGGWR